MSTIVPRDYVSYWIQNVDYGTYLTLGHVSGEGPQGTGHRNSGISLTGRVGHSDARLTVMLKNDARTLDQEWVLRRHDSGNGEAWTITNRREPLSISNDAAATFDAEDSPPSPPVLWTFERVPQAGNHFRIMTMGSKLQLSLKSEYELALGPGEDTDAMTWRLIEICPIFGQDGHAYRFRNLNARLLTVESSGELIVHTEHDALSSHHRTLWTLDPTKDGKCCIKLFESSETQYLTCAGSDNYTVSQGARFDWSLESIGPGQFGHSLAYAVKATKGIDLAMSVEDEEAEYSQLWFLEALTAAEADEAEAPRKAAEEAARKAAAEAAARKAAEEAAAKKAAEEAAARRAAEEAARRAAQEEASRRAAQEEAARRAAQEEAARRAAQEEAYRRAAEEEAYRRAAEEEAYRRAAEAEAYRRAAEAAATPKAHDWFRENYHFYLCRNCGVRSSAWGAPAVFAGPQPPQTPSTYGCYY